MRILITAGNGQLGTDATAYFSKSNEVISIADVDLDITDEKKVNDTIIGLKPEVILNTAAVTNVDGCETNEELAYRVNGYGAGVIAKAAQKVGATLVHISTDYVFDGLSRSAYKETDEPNPNNVYGKSKLCGEKNVMENCDRFFILRTAWLYGPHGKNFVKTMLKIAKEKGEVSVVTDQSGNPTSTFELIRIIDSVLKKGRYGIYHATCEGVCSWNAFSREIFKCAGIDVKVNDITSDKLPQGAACRPPYSDLSKEKLYKDTGYRPTEWQKALQEYFDYRE